jgi:hypothetical protein
LSRREALLTRVVDGEATDAEWAEFRAMADAEVPAGAPSAWRDLAEAQRTQALMAGAVGDVLAAAEGVEAPAVSRGLRLVGAGGGVTPLRRMVAAGGWLAAAAALGLAWANGWMARPAGSAGAGAGEPAQASVIPAGLYRIETPEDAVRVYKEKGRQAGSVVDELPQRVLVQAVAKECCPGEYTVVYVRQFVERADVKDLYQFAQDEAGRITLTRGGALPAAATVRSSRGM